MMESKSFQVLVSTADAHEPGRRLQHPLERDLVFGLECVDRMTSHRRTNAFPWVVGGKDAWRHLGFADDDFVRCRWNIWQRSIALEDNVVPGESAVWDSELSRSINQMDVHDCSYRSRMSSYVCMEMTSVAVVLVGIMPWR